MYCIVFLPCGHCSLTPAAMGGRCRVAAVRVVSPLKLSLVLFSGGRLQWRRRWGLLI